MVCNRILHPKLVNRWLTEVDARDLGAAIWKPLHVLAQKRSQTTMSPAHEQALFHGITRRTGLHYRSKARRRANPIIKGVGPLFVAYGPEDHRYVALGCNPSHRLEQAELCMLILRESRDLGPLRFRAFVEVCRFVRDHGTQKGAFSTLARRAVLNGRRVVRIHRECVHTAFSERELRRVARQIRERYREACRYIENRAALLGYPVRSLT